jgi:tetratricopeptide (TPR) repeat protein
MILIMSRSPSPFNQSELVAMQARRDGYEAALAARGHDSRFLIEYGSWLIYVARDYAHAVEILKRALPDGTAFFHLGQAYRKLSRFEDAESAFAEVLEQYPAHEKALRQLVDLCLKNFASPLRTLEILKNARAKLPDSMPLSSNLAVLLEHCGRLPEARAELEAMREHAASSQAGTELLVKFLDRHSEAFPDACQTILALLRSGNNLAEVRAASARAAAAAAERSTVALPPIVFDIYRIIADTPEVEMLEIAIDAYLFRCPADRTPVSDMLSDARERISANPFDASRAALMAGSIIKSIEYQLSKLNRMPFEADPVSAVYPGQSVEEIVSTVATVERLCAGLERQPRFIFALELLVTLGEKCPRQLLPSLLLSIGSDETSLFSIICQYLECASFSHRRHLDVNRAKLKNVASILAMHLGAMSSNHLAIKGCLLIYYLYGERTLLAQLMAKLLVWGVREPVLSFSWLPEAAHIPSLTSAVLPPPPLDDFAAWADRFARAAQPDKDNILLQAIFTEGERLMLFDSLVFAEDWDTVVRNMAVFDCLAAEKANGLVQSLQDNWRPDLLIEFYEAASSALKDLLTATSVCMVAEAYLIRGRPNEAEAIAAKIIFTEQFAERAALLLLSMGKRGEVARLIEQTIIPNIADRVYDAAEIPKLLKFLLAINFMPEAEYLLKVFKDTDGIVITQKGGRAKMSRPLPSGFLLEVASFAEVRGDFHLALGIFRSLQVIDGSTPKVLFGIARNLYEIGEVSAAREILIMASPTLQVSFSQFNALFYHVLLSTGFVGEALAMHRRRIRAKTLRDMVGPEKYPLVFDIGNKPARKLTLIADSGPGDEIRFASLYADLVDTGHSITISCDPRLCSLFTRSFPTIEFTPVRRFRPEVRDNIFDDTYKERSNLRDPDLARSIDNRLLNIIGESDLAGWVIDTLGEFRTTRESFPRVDGYLRPDAFLVEMWKSRINNICCGKMAVGLSWRSLLQSSWRSKHYSRIEDWGRLLADEQIAVVSLQPGMTEAERATIAANGWNLTEFPDLDLRDDFENIAALMVALDGVISSATTMIELAGAVGAKGWLHSTSEQTIWRKNDDGSDVWHSSLVVEDGRAEVCSQAFLERIRHRICV